MLRASAWGLAKVMASRRAKAIGKHRRGNPIFVMFAFAE
jgi:hypothetical protein